MDRAGAQGDQRHGTTGDRTHRRGCRLEANRQVGAGSRADCERRSAECLAREYTEGDGLALLRHLETLVDGCGGGVDGVTPLRGLDGARATSDQLDRGT